MSDQNLPSLLYLWDKRTVYIGPLFEPLSLSQGAATLILSLNKPVRFKTETMIEAIECRSLLLPAGFAVTIDTGDALVVNCNLDALGEDFFRLSGNMTHQQDDALYQIQHEADFISQFHRIYSNQLTSDSALKAVNQIFEEHIHHPERPFIPDQRISNVIDVIKATVDDNLSVEDLAQSVNLSVPRLVQLFKQQTGVPIRRYRLWHRLFVAATQMAKGESMTTAAMTAGFTDSSHLSHTFRSMFGMKPSLMLQQPNKIKLLTNQ